MRNAWAIAVLAGCTGAPEGTPAPGGGQLIIEQIGLSGIGLGEAALVVGDDGTSVLIDVGNDGHTDDVRDAMARHGLTAIDWVVLTHFHADHIGAVDALFTGEDAVEVREGIVWRGDVDTGDANRSELDEVREVLRTVPSVDLCDDDGCALPWTVPVGSASLAVFLANGYLGHDEGVDDLGVPLTEENARSLGGAITLGSFTYVFAGDLTGGGKDTPDVESAVASRAEQLSVVPAHQVDVLHVSHHGISSSTNEAWAEWLLGDGDANAVVGATGTYLDAPSEEALEVLRGRLGAGRVWVTETGLLGGGDPLVVDGRGSSVVVEVQEGDSYHIGLLDDGQVIGESFALRE